MKAVSEEHLLRINITDRYDLSYQEAGGEHFQGWYRSQEKLELCAGVSVNSLGSSLMVAMWLLLHRTSHLLKLVFKSGREEAERKTSLLS